MNHSREQQTSKKIEIMVSVAAIVLVAANLRAPITALGPVLDEVIAQLGLSSLEASLLTSIPLFVFAVMSALVSRFSTKLGTTNMVLVALLVLSFGLYMRIVGTTSAIFFGSFMIGLGICVGNVMMPGYIKSVFSNQVGLMTGVFAVSMNLSAALASGLSIKIGQLTTYGWKGSIGIWGILSMVAALVWLIELVFRRKNTVGSTHVNATTQHSFLRSKQAWNISLFMGLQSLIYYCVIAWLPTALISVGFPKEETGWVLSISQLAMIPVTFIAPIIAMKLPNQRPLVALSGLCFMIGILLLLLFKADYVYLASVLIGIGAGLAFSLCILFFSIRTESPLHAVKISGMSQSIGYGLAGFGPGIFGKLYEYSDHWDYSYYFLLLSTILLIYFGMNAAKNRSIEDDLEGMQADKQTNK